MYTVMVSKEYKEVYTADIKIIKTDSDTAEMAKYIENAYLATKIIFCNEMYDISQAYGIDYDELRGIWLMDPRINRSHTFVFENNRGYGDSCFPKDMKASENIAKDMGVDCELITAFIEKNNKYRKND